MRKIGLLGLLLVFLLAGACIRTPQEQELSPVREENETDAAETEALSGMETNSAMERNEMLQRWNVTGDILRKILLREYNNSNYLYEEQTENHDFTGETSKLTPLDFFNPYGEYYIEAYEVLSDLPDEEELSVNPYARCLHEGELFVRYGPIQQMEEGVEGVYTVVQYNGMGYPYLTSVTLPGTVEEAGDALRLIYRDSFWVEPDQWHSYPYFPEKEEITSLVKDEMMERLSERLADGETAEAYILDFEVYAGYILVQAVSFVDEVLYVDLFTADKQEDAVVIRDFQRGDGQVVLTKEEQRQNGITQSMAGERAIEQFTYPEVYTLSGLFAMETWADEIQEIYILAAGPDDELHRPQEVYRVKEEYLADCLRAIEEIPATTSIEAENGEWTYRILLCDHLEEDEMQTSHDINLFASGEVLLDYQESYLLYPASVDYIQPLLDKCEEVELFSVEELLMRRVDPYGDEGFQIEYMDTEGFKERPYVITETGTEELRGTACRYEFMWIYDGYSFGKNGTCYHYYWSKKYYRLDTGELFDVYDGIDTWNFITGQYEVYSGV